MPFRTASPVYLRLGTGTTIHWFVQSSGTPDRGAMSGQTLTENPNNYDLTYDSELTSHDLSVPEQGN